MKYTITINQEKALEWGLNMQEASLVDLFLLLPHWAEMEVIEGEIWYFFSKTKILDELPMLSKTGKIDTIYRQVKGLEEAGLVSFQKIGRKDFWKLTNKIKEWTFENSEKNPRKLGKKSEEDSEKNPTYNDTIGDNNTIDKSLAKNKFSEESFDYKISKFFLEKMKERKIIQTMYNIEKYGEDYVLLTQIDAVEKLQRLDKYPPEIIKMVIVFAMNHSFWKNQILSLKKLREKNPEGLPYFVVLLGKMKEVHETEVENIVHKF